MGIRGQFLPGWGIRNAPPRLVGNPLLLVYKDLFTTDDPAPIAAPRICEPGPGTMAIVDTGSKLGIVGSKLKFNGATAQCNPGVWFGSTVSKPGLAILLTITPKTA
jgi:hypothetical protein